MLAEAPLAAGSPKELLADVRWADWDAAGQLAAVHYMNGHSRLEYPIGHVLYQSNGWISNVRFSPQGDRIAFMDHPGLYDDRGSVCVTDLSGNVRVLSSGWDSEDGLAWSPNGQEVWFTAAEKGHNRSLRAVSLSGRVRTLLDLPVTITLQDVAADSRILVSLDSERLGMAGATQSAPAGTDLSWHDWNIAREISRDGTWVLFEDSSEAAGPGYAVALRKMDGSPPIRLGEGIAGGLSPDGKWAVSISVGNPERLTLLPTGTGAPKPIPTKLEHIENYSIRFLSDGKRIIVSGNEQGRPARCFLQSVDGGDPVPITPEGVLGSPVSPDDRYVVGFGAGGEVALYPLDRTSPRSVPGLPAGFTPVQWSADSSALYGYVYGGLPAKVYKIDIVSGKKTVIEELPTPAGVVNIAPVVVDRSGTRFAYSYYQVLSALSLISGVR
jgi:dipeptidyl aminopeptidase/acylaminoacyl peptidase